ncbi:MAG: hypothetical protein Q3979_05470 [Actinomycetaceae bacterium]|nr:hypothetical protein [Actinomycetaceae bacterium]
MTVFAAFLSPESDHPLADPAGWVELHAADAAGAGRLATKWLGAAVTAIVPLDELDQSAYPAGRLASAAEHCIIWRRARLHGKAA